MSAERTLLAWIRTGIAVMAFGFVVARFGLFLQLMPAGNAAQVPSRLSTYLGALLLLIGVAGIAAGAVHYRSYTSTLPQEDMPTRHPLRLPLLLAWSLVALGAVLVIVLVM